MAVTETTTKTAANRDLEANGGPVVPAEVIDELLAKVRADGLELLGDGGIIAELTKKILERALDEELTDHVGYERGDQSGRNLGNSRNGTTPKRVLTEIGAVDLDIPRDRDGTFEPKLVPKGTTRLARFNENIIALYAAGMSTRDITKTLKRMYSVEVSADLISRVTDGVLAELAEWQARPLDAVYPIVFGLTIPSDVRSRRWSPHGTPGPARATKPMKIMDSDDSARRTGKVDVANLEVLDLTDHGVRSELGVELVDLVGDEYTKTQQIARAAATVGFGGILALSAALLPPQSCGDLHLVARPLLPSSDLGRANKVSRSYGHGGRR